MFNFSDDLIEPEIFKDESNNDEDYDDDDDEIPEITETRYPDKNLEILNFLKNAKIKFEDEMEISLSSFHKTESNIQLPENEAELDLFIFKNGLKYKFVKNLLKHDTVLLNSINFDIIKSVF